MQVVKGWTEAESASGDDLDPGAIQKYVKPSLTNSSTMKDAHAKLMLEHLLMKDSILLLCKHKSMFAQNKNCGENRTND
jgi:hypothetical protein